MVLVVFFSGYIYDKLIKCSAKEKYVDDVFSILSVVSKTYERCLSDQIWDYFENRFLKY